MSTILESFEKLTNNQDHAKRRIDILPAQGLWVDNGQDILRDLKLHVAQSLGYAAVTILGC